MNGTIFIFLVAPLFGGSLWDCHDSVYLDYVLTGSLSSLRAKLKSKEPSHGKIKPKKTLQTKGL